MTRDQLIAAILAITVVGLFATVCLLHFVLDPAARRRVEVVHEVPPVNLFLSADDLLVDAVVGGEVQPLVRRCQEVCQ